MAATFHQVACSIFRKSLLLLMVPAQFALVAVLGAGVMVPPISSTATAVKQVPERWRQMAQAWTKEDDEVTTKKWGLEVAIIKRGMDVVGLSRPRTLFFRDRLFCDRFFLQSALPHARLTMCV